MSRVPRRLAARSPAPLAGLVRSCHPQPTAGVTTLVTGLAVALGAGPARVALVAVTVLVGQLSIGWSNDALDRGRDVAAGRLDKPVATGDVDIRTVGAAAALALGAAVPLSFAAGPAAGLAHLGVVAGGWAYNLGLKRTLWSWVPYAIAFGLLPAYAALAQSGAPRPAGWLVAAGSLLGTGAHFFNVLPDIDDDRATGVASLPVRLGARAGRWAGSALLVAAAAVVVFGPPGPAGATGLGGFVAATGFAAAAAVSGRHDEHSRKPFRWALLAAAVDLALLALLVDPAGALR